MMQGMARQDSMGVGQQRLAVAIAAVAFVALVLAPPMLARPRLDVIQRWEAPGGIYGMTRLRMEVIQEEAGWWINSTPGDAYLLFRCGFFLSRQLRMNPPAQIRGKGTTWVETRFDVTWRKDGVVIRAPRWGAPALFNGLKVSERELQALRPCF